ncbi:mRNA-decapping enzyme subunit 2 [Phtheirospermum japonicum]|uniref:mRNA-decapping enzyme subunit 2 n=1 Tax=Phtheirospermum japonicum TaxID=374723 RepID=A0A830BA29_9LAMI|nr:mRNA-decapping enzyme subunit 2 [Phtheirospermum japonicum]
MSSGLNRSSSAPSKNILPPQELLDDLCSRFVLNVPKEDQQSFERILFLVEYAHWFYEDNSVEKNPSLKSLTLKEFTTLLFNNCDVLKPYVAHIDDIFKDFTSYKVRVPVTGAIILDETYERCLLVKGWKGTSWSFPRGKKSKDEEDHKCAIREVLEETGFDVSSLLNKDDHIEMIFGQQREIAWQRLDELPANVDVISRGVTGLKLYMVSPFLASLKSWISVHPPPVAPRSDKPCKGSLSFYALYCSFACSHLYLCCILSSMAHFTIFGLNRGISVWRAKHSSSGGSSSSTAVESQQPMTKAVADVRHSDTSAPSRSFLNFRFDTGPIFRAVDAAFST